MGKSSWLRMFKVKNTILGYALPVCKMSMSKHIYTIISFGFFCIQKAISIHCSIFIKIKQKHEENEVQKKYNNTVLGAAH